MKFVISFLICLNAYASPINVFHEGEDKDAKIYRDILINEYMIPEDLIGFRSTQSCEGMKPVGKLDFCLKNNGDLYMVSVDREFINESLKVFRAP